MSEKQTHAETFVVFEKRYTLTRYPQRHRRELRAWDTADLYLLNTLSPLLPTIETICILNDNFGALTLPLAELNPLCYGDSWMSRRALELNSKVNHMPLNINFEESLAALTTHHPPPSCVIGRVPKSSSQLEYLLKCLNHWLEPDTLLMLAGMDKHLSRGQYQLLERYFGPSKYLPGVRKARVWQARCDPDLRVNQSLTSHLEITIPECDLTITALPNVFSRESLDIGSRFFLHHFDRLPMSEKVADLACGYGVLGLAYLRFHPQAHLIFCDESFQAVMSTRINKEKNIPNAQSSIYADDGLKQVKDASLGLVICNPPFHQQHTISADLAHSMFQDAYRSLQPGGELWIVANRHLGYHIHLKRLFGHCSVEASDKKFVILRSIKSSR